jgi:hypothetical protein
MQIERIFNTKSGMSFNDILQTIIDEKVDSLVKYQYDHNQVNTVTSHDERTNAE